MPHLSENQHEGRRKRDTSRAAIKPSLSIPLLRSESSPTINQQNASSDINSMLGPAIDGPPSPERLRQLSKQMKRGSFLNRPPGLYNTSSSPSSLRTMASEARPAWEQALSDMSLARRASNRSANSSTPSGERPESVQVVGRSFFQRSRMKRASSSHSSSNSSLYSAETSFESLTSKESLMPTLFARRKPSRDETLSQRKMQISGPFNFQHVTHTQCDNLPASRDTSRTAMDLSSDFQPATSPAPVAASNSLHFEAHDLPLRQTSMGTFDEIEQGPLTAPPTRPALTHYHTAPLSGLRRTIKHAKSQDFLRSSPPRTVLGASVRTSRSPSESSLVSPPLPPPRTSSRQSISLEGFNAFASGSLDRPRTSGGFRQPQPYDPSEAEDEVPMSPKSHGVMPSAEHGTPDTEDKSSSFAMTTSDEASWPLAGPASSPTAFEKALPDVPEEEEQSQHHQYSSPKKSRLSVTSNNSSLRGSQSVPALRLFSQSQRPMSGASDTLGQLDMSAAQRAMRAVLQDAQGDDEDFSPDNWEDDIDYCYEHEADANFNYQWERPSLDAPRAEIVSPAEALFLEEDLTEIQPPSSVKFSFGLQPDAPGLSPASQTSPAQGFEVITPNESLAVTNFSFPHREKGSRVSQLRSIRPISYASTFKESHGFHLSPSLLIPGDYRDEMFETEKDSYQLEDEILSEAYEGPYYDEDAPYGGVKSSLSYEQRSSTSTTETASSSHSDERHTSTQSNFTALTRLTISSTSSTSLSKMSGLTEADESVPMTFTVDTLDEHEVDQETTPPANRDVVPELVPFPSAQFTRRPYHRSHASESLLHDEIVPLKSQEAAKMRRPRARTSSLGTQAAPPVGQYALFPRSYVNKSNGNRI